MTDLITKKDFEIAKLEQNLNKITDKLSPLLNELEYVKRTIGTTQTAHEREIGNIQMSGNSPLIWMKQCYAQINQRLEGVVNTFYKLKKLKNKIDKLEAKATLTPDQIVTLSEHKTQYVLTEGYLQNAFSEIEHYKLTAEKIKTTFNIPDDITSDDMDKASAEDHIKTAFKQAIQDVTQTGNIGKGTFGHLEQWGIHPYTAKWYVDQYISHCHDLLKQGQTPNIKHLYKFLEEMYEMHKESYLDNKTRLGI